ncbi:zinc finger and BTB domain-containing protein 17-like [Engraulis encrasicolus]|uniref:zinc finger and BTB domain-containing protein 17-like n=1 Tax=Engraulis encrasicolus TaxID=184585 RepID=UPI002FD66825
MALCAVKSCENKYKRHRQLMFHRIPHQPERMQQWISACGINPSTPVEKMVNYRVCEEHFTPEDYMDVTFFMRGPTRKLKDTAVPSIFKPQTVPDAEPSSPQSVSSSTGLSSPVSTPTVTASDAESRPSLPLTTVKEGRSTSFLRSENLQEEVTVQVSCLLQLFDRCLGCSAGSCSVLTRRDGRVFHVTQQCWTCQIIVEWNSHTADSGTANKQQEGRGKGGVMEIKEEWEEIQVEEEEEEEEEEEQQQLREEQRGAGRRKQRTPLKEEGGEEDWAPEDDQMLSESERPSSCSEEYDDDGVDDEDWEQELCSDCGKRFRNRPDKPHVCLHKAKPVECHICGKRCLNKQGLSVHIAHCHERGPQCKYCNMILRDTDEKLHHEETSHRDEEGPKFRCADCSERFHDYESRAAHRKTAHPPNTTCPYCDRKFKKECHLKRHKLIHTGKKPFVCRLCDRSFSQRGHLKSHMRLHTGERPFKCPQCERSFNHNVSLKNHLQRHHGAKTGPAQQDQQEASGTQQEGSRTDQSSGTLQQTLLSRPEEDANSNQNSITCSRTDQSS